MADPSEPLAPSEWDRCGFLPYRSFHCDACGARPWRSQIERSLVPLLEADGATARGGLGRGAWDGYRAELWELRVPRGLLFAPAACRHPHRALRMLAPAPLEPPMPGFEWRVFWSDSLLLTWTLLPLLSSEPVLADRADLTVRERFEVAAGAIDFIKFLETRPGPAQGVHQALRVSSAELREDIERFRARAPSGSDTLLDYAVDSGVSRTTLWRHRKRLGLVSGGKRRPQKDAIVKRGQSGDGTRGVSR